MAADVFTVRQMLAEKQQQTLICANPAMSVLEALYLMRDFKVGALLVMQGDDFKGIITERDYAWHVELDGKTAAKTSVGEIMTPAEKVISVGMFKSFEECLVLMDENHIRHLPVIKEGKVQGMISIRDVMRGIVRHQIFLAQQFLEGTGGRT